MPSCARCRKDHFGIFELKGGFCQRCRAENESAVAKRAHARSEAADNVDIDQIIVTTENHSGLQIKERIDIVSAECAFGMNVFKDLFAGVRDVVGGRSEAVQQTLRDSRAVVLHELRSEAALVGGNAIIGVQFDYVDLSAAGKMVLLVASGTAVILE